MLEYIFFDERPWQKFIQFLEQRQLDHLPAREEQGYLVRLPEDIDDARMDEIEAYYDEMLDMNEALFVEQADEAEHRHAAGISVNLSDGRTVQAEVDPALLNRLLQVVSIDELGRFVNAIADAVEHPDERSICRR